MKIREIIGKRFNYLVKSIKDDEIEIVEVPFSYKRYDENGNLLSDISYGSAGNIAEKLEYVFEDKLLKKKLIYLDENEIAETHVYHYQNDKIASKTIEYLDGNIEDILFSYNAAGNLISIASEEGEGGSEKMEYENSKLIRHLIIDDFEEVEKDEKRYYEQDKLVRIESVNFDEGETRKIITYINEDSKIISEEIYNEKRQKIASKSFIYSESGKLERIDTHSINGNTSLVFEYDEGGNEILQKEFDADDNILHQVSRVFNADNTVNTAEVEIFNYGKSIDIHYRIEYAYNYFE